MRPRFGDGRVFSYKQSRSSKCAGARRGHTVCYRSRLLRSMANCNRSSQLTPSPSLHDPQVFYGLCLTTVRQPDVRKATVPCAPVDPVAFVPPWLSRTLTLAPASGAFVFLSVCRFPLMRRLWRFHSVFTINV